MTLKPRTNLRSGEHRNPEAGDEHFGSRQAALEDRIADALGEIRTLDATGIAVTASAHAVILTGFVTTEEECQAAEECVRALAGEDRAIDNRLAVDHGSG